MKQKSISIRPKLYGIVATLSIALILNGVIGYWISKKLSKNLQVISLTTMPTLRELVLIDMVHDGVRGVALQSLYGNLKKNPSQIVQASRDLDEHESNTMGYLKEIEARELSPEFQNLFRQSKEELLKYFATTEALIESAKKDPHDTVLVEFQKFQESFTNLEERLGKMGEFFEQESKSHVTEYIEDANKQTYFLISLIVGCLTLGMIIAALAGRSILKTLEAVSQDLSKRAETIQHSINTLTETSQELSSATTQQAASVQETAAGIEEINSMIQRSSENAKESRQSSELNQRKADQGLETMRSLSQAITEINLTNQGIKNEVESNNKRLEEIVKVIQEIEGKTKVINDIVFQTKLLSFNASVEAARAGEHGKGFAVVAEEVGNLAVMSGQASKEISTLLIESVKTVEGIVGETKEKIGFHLDKSKQTVDRGVQIAESCQSLLDEIQKSSEEVVGSIQNISSASEEQARGAQEISKAVHELNQVTQTNAHVAETCVKTSRELQSEVEGVGQSVQKLNQMLN